MPNIKWEDVVVGPFRIGHFIGALLTFVIVAFVIFMIVKVTKRWGLE